MSLRTRLALVLALLLGCDGATVQNAEEQTAVGRPTQVTTGNVEGPIATTLSGPAAPRAGDEIVLSVRIDRRLLKENSDVSVQLKLPEQVKLRRGARRTRVLPDSVPVAELHYALQLDALPDEDAIIVVTAMGDGFGYRASLSYRFGRESALPESAPREANAVRVGERSFGAAVPINSVP